MSVDWRPYPSKQALPLSAYAAWHAEQLDFAALVTGLEDRPKVHNGPCVALIDPRIVADPAARDHLRMTLRDMPKWVLPLLVLDEDDGSSLAGLAESARELLSAAVEDLPASAIHHTSSFEEFLDVLPPLIAEAERRYIRYGPAPVPVDTTSRPYRLRTSSPEGEKTDG
jgi:hypothetical protein